MKNPMAGTVYGALEHFFCHGAVVCFNDTELFMVIAYGDAIIKTKHGVNIDTIQIVTIDIETNTIQKYDIILTAMLNSVQRYTVLNRQKNALLPKKHSNS